MLLKRMDETIAQGLYDLDAGPAEVEVYLAEPSLQNNLVHWEIVDDGFVPRELLHYNDTADGSNTLNGSWQKFYASGADLGERVIYNGSSIYFANGFPNFGGVAKATIYLRYSPGFLRWLSAFDSTAAETLRNEVPAFEEIMENRETKKLPTAWHDFKAPRNRWPLLTVCRLSNGKRLVHWLNESPGNYEALTELDIDVRHSWELMHFLTAPETMDKELIADEFQSGSGLGRNAFGKTFKLEEINRSEYQRLMGALPKSSRSELLDLWSKKAEYRVKVAPSPDASSLIFLPEGNLSYRELKHFIDSENEKKTRFYEAKNAKKSGNEDRESLKAARPEVIPVAESATVFLTNIEGGQKKKRIIQQIFYSVSLGYLQVLNAEILNSGIQYAVVEYMKKALTGQDADTPSVYRYWTDILTNALQKQPVAAWELYHNFQRYAKNFKGDELIDKLGARTYFKVIGKVLRLQHLIETARTDPAALHTNEFQQQLIQIESGNGIKRGVFGAMKTTIPTAAELIGNESCELLRNKQKTKLDNFIRQSWAGVPDADFAVFVRGALTGMLLNELCWSVQQEGRRFTATQGRHPSRLRGRELIDVFDKGIGLLMNLDKAQLFNCRLLPFVKSMELESRRDSFNSGLIIGMVYFEKKNNDNNSDENNEVKND